MQKREREEFSIRLELIITFLQCCMSIFQSHLLPKLCRSTLRQVVSSKSTFTSSSTTKILTPTFPVPQRRKSDMQGSIPSVVALPSLTLKTLILKVTPKTPKMETFLLSMPMIPNFGTPFRLRWEMKLKSTKFRITSLRVDKISEIILMRGTTRRLIQPEIKSRWIMGALAHLKIIKDRVRSYSKRVKLVG